MKQLKRGKLALATLLLGVLVGSAHGQDLTGRLKKIKETGVITLGVRDSSIPFSYLTENQTYIGYAVDLCLEAATAVQRELGLSKLDIKMLPVTAVTRIPLIANGTIDLNCDSATNNEERQKTVTFAPTIFVTSSRIMAKKSSSYRKLDDLKGKVVVASSGTSNVKQLATLNGERKLGITILTARDHAEAFLMFETDRAQAIINDDIILASLAATSKSPGDYVLSSEALSVEPLGIIEPLNDPAFKKVVDAAISNVYRSGEINRIYAKWFQSPIPPKGVNLNIPMSAEFKAVVAKPTDSPIAAEYALSGK